MTTDTEAGPRENRYPLPLYLNQKYVFDVLSMMEGGFSQLETVTFRSGGENESSGGLSGEVGFKNVFGLLNVSLGGGRTRRSRTEEGQEVSRERVHTPNSLFARMRERLHEEDLVHEGLEGAGLIPGVFVELPMRLEKNPLLESVETLASLMRMATIFQEPAPSGSGTRKQARNRTRAPSEEERMLQQINDLKTQLSTGDVVDLIATPTASNEAPNVVLTLDLAYAADESLSDLIDGEYSVLGKTTRIITKESDETINLLRKTTLGRLQASTLSELGTAMEELESGGIALPQFKTEIEPPVVQILPIAVFA